jgi:hypothetical protein
VFAKGRPFAGGRVSLKLFLWAFCGDMTENGGPIRTSMGPTLHRKKITPSPALFGTHADALHVMGSDPPGPSPPGTWL